MKIEYLPDGSDDCPMIRLYDFAQSEIADLFAAVTTLASSERLSVAVDELAGVETISECRLTLRSGVRDIGVVHVDARASFECGLRPEGWDNVAGLIEPFLNAASGYQWLVMLGDARLLHSVDGQW